MRTSRRDAVAGHKDVCCVSGSKCEGRDELLQLFPGRLDLQIAGSRSGRASTGGNEDGGDGDEASAAGSGRVATGLAPPAAWTGRRRPAEAVPRRGWISWTLEMAETLISTGLLEIIFN